MAVDDPISTSGFTSELPLPDVKDVQSIGETGLTTSLLLLVRKLVSCRKETFTHPLLSPL